ncbi:MAG: CrcB family protein [Puniceicoccaceae bacterium]|nr:CrcB family protein [Puniceicoccaceae bacterium]MBL6838904.1 CrcB family protein [Puniceicoccaceae bacterium]MBL6912549.1 CrcB family protein [Puniceicoccaceae bacterium]
MRGLCSLQQLLWIGLGSGLGGGLRYLLDSLVVLAGLAVMPLSTLFINLTGSFLIGYLAGLWATGGAMTAHPYKWHFWITGFCGGYTTFSTFSWHILELVQKGEGSLAGAYAAGSIALGLIAVWMGLSLAMRKPTVT